MIHQCTFMYMPAQVNTAKLGRAAVFVSPFNVVKQLMEETSDTLIWIVTRKQLHDFLAKVKEYDLMKYCVVAHTHVGEDYDASTGLAKKDKEGCSNYNYPSDPRKLKVFVMKGAKAQ